MMRLDCEYLTYLCSADDESNKTDLSVDADFEITIPTFVLIKRNNGCYSIEQSGVLA